MDVDLQLRPRVAHRRQRGNGGDFARPQVESGPRIDVAERKFEHVPRKIGRDVGEGVDHLLSGLAVYLGESLGATFVAAFGMLGHCCAFVFRLPP
jgi:hypothetical protein